jgi:hypothetical protein
VNVVLLRHLGLGLALHENSGRLFRLLRPEPWTIAGT